MKKILIYGMGKTGIELKKFCKRNSINFCTFDDKTDNQSDFIKLSEKCSYIVVSPGIGLRNKNLKIAIKKKIKIISEIEFASKFLDKPIIAITGTNGKTTTAMLTEKLLTSAGIKVFLGGNIGTPLINAVNSKEKFDLILVEVSSFQLQFIDLSFKPFVSALLNISENHLDHHLNFREYKESKMKIFKNQNKTDYSLIVQPQFIKKNIKSNRINPLKNNKIYETDDNIIIENMKIRKDELKLLGPHNIKNILFSLNIFSLFKKPTKKQINVLRNFSSPPHRLQRISRNRIIINDSKSTSPQATEVAIKSFNRKIILIMGGKNKGLNYNSLLKLIKDKVKLLILCGENKFELSKIFDSNSNLIASNLLEAVTLGLKNLKSEEVLLFSPGTSSFDQYDSFTHRGEIFTDYVKKLS